MAKLILSSFNKFELDFPIPIPPIPAIFFPTNAPELDSLILLLELLPYWFNVFYNRPPLLKWP